MRRLYINLHRAKTAERNAELETCLIKNLESGLFDEVINVSDQQFDHPEIININTDKWPTYADFFNVISKTAKEGDISVLANLDIFFDDTIELADKMRPVDAYALTRYDWEPNKEPVFFNRNDSQDVWIFKGPLRAIKGADFTMGVPGCDNKLAYLLAQAGYSVSNPSLSIKTYHYHATNQRNYLDGSGKRIVANVPPPYLSLPPKRIPGPKGELKMFYLGLCADTPPNGMQEALKLHCDSYIDLNCGRQRVNEEAVAIAREHKPNLIFMQIQAKDVISIGTLNVFKEIGAKVLNWTGDVRNTVPPWMKDVAPHLDVTLFSNMRDVSVMRANGFKADYLEIGYDETIYCPEGPKLPTPPIVFFGNNYGPRAFPLSAFRIEMVDRLKTKFDGIFGVFGSGWANASGNYNGNQRNEAAAYRSSKIAINCSHYDIQRYSSDRLLRILGMGTPICLAKAYPEMPFEDGKHLRTWNSIKELEALIEYYMDPKNEEERKAIATEGYKLASTAYTFKNMAKNIVTIYNGL